jgi:hypothetical protein
MVTPIVMLLLMVGPYRILRSFPAARRRDFDGRGAAAVGLGRLFVFTSVGHFIQTAPMALGHAWGPQYLLIRIPVQIMILLWVYRLAIRPPKPAREVGLASR